MTHPSLFLYLSFSNNNRIIFCMNWWGPVSIKYIFTIVICFYNVGAYIFSYFQIQLCPRVKGACVFKYFSPSNPINQSALYFDGVGIIFSYFLETNLVGPCLYSTFLPPFICFDFDL